jgi:acetyl-CoA carboxylase biotin carboxyl carrier protein
MDLSKIKTLIDFVGKSRVSELTVTEKGTTVRIFRNGDQSPAVGVSNSPRVLEPAQSALAPHLGAADGVVVKAPVFGVLHRSSAPGEAPFVSLGDTVEQGQTLFIIEAMKIFNKISAPKSGRVVSLTATDGAEVDTGETLAEIA